jgi:hypothetical protein
VGTTGLVPREVEPLRPAGRREHAVEQRQRRLDRHLLGQPVEGEVWEDVGVPASVGREVGELRHQPRGQLAEPLVRLGHQVQRPVVEPPDPLQHEVERRGLRSDRRDPSYDVVGELVDERPERRHVRVDECSFNAEVRRIVVLGPRPDVLLQRRHRHLQHRVAGVHATDPATDGD